MRPFFACFSGELKKLSMRKKYFVLTIIGAALCILFTLLSMLIGRLISNGAVNSVFQNLPMTILPLMTQAAIPLIAAMAVCDLFASEYHDFSIKAQIMRPVTRFKIFSAKILASFLMCAFILIAMLIVSALCGAVMIKSTSGLAYAFFAYLINLFPVMIIILMAALINQFTKNSTSAMFLCIIIYILIKVLGMVFPVLDTLLFTGYLQWHKLWLGIPLPPAILIAKCILLLGYGITFFSGGYCLFLKREF